MMYKNDFKHQIYKKGQVTFQKNEWLEVGTKVFQLRAIQNNGQI